MSVCCRNIECVTQTPDVNLPKDVNAYAVAFDEWEKSGEARAWDSTAADGIEP